MNGNGNGGPGFGIEQNLVLDEVGFGLGGKPLRRGGTAFPAASRNVEPARAEEAATREEPKPSSKERAAVNNIG